MNLRNLSYFLAAAEELNITRAARRLYISQQALSNHLAALEEEVGARLFERSPRLALTPAGERMRKAAEEILDIHKVLLQEINDLQNECRGELKLGISFFHSLALMPRILPEFQRAHPLVELTLVESTAAAMEDALEAGQLDLALTLTPLHRDCFAAIPLGEERLMLSVPHGVMLRRYGEEADARARDFASGVSLEEFFDEPLIMYDQKEHLSVTVEGFYARHGAAPRILMRTRNLHTAFALSREGMGVTIFPAYFLHSPLFASPSYAESPVHTFPLTDSELTASLVIAYHRQRYLSRAAREMIGALRDAL